MSAYRVLLAVPDDETATNVADLLSETDDLQLVRVVQSSGELIAAVEEAEAEVVVLHEDIGPLPAFDLARDLSIRAPDTGLVLLADEPTPATLDAALQAGFRGIARAPLSLEDVSATLTAAGSWSEAVRQRLSAGEDALTEQRGGRMVAVAGAKGGVGTTTIAVQLALAAQRAGRRVCLVDFDLQAGDARAYLDLAHRRSVADLVGVAGELTGRQLDDALSMHTSGLRVLLPPPEGEQGEDITAEVARPILGGLRSRFDVVVVDVGTIVSDGGAVATEMADEAVVVVTPDVPAMRAANRLLSLWERLHIRKDDTKVCVNQLSRDSEIQPDMLGKVIAAPVCQTTLPAGFWTLEHAANTGSAERLDDGAVRRGIDALATELGVGAARRRSRGLSLRGQSGEVTVESMGMLPIIALVLLLLWELALAGFTYQLSTHSSREAARELAVTTKSGEELTRHLAELARDEVPAGWRDDLELDVDGDRARVTLAVPLLVPGVSSPFTISSEQGTIREGRSGRGELGGHATGIW